MNWLEILATYVVLAMPAPFITYFVIRAGAIAYFRSRFEYEQRRSKPNG